jgi:hypothetical protein
MTTSKKNIQKIKNYVKEEAGISFVKFYIGKASIRFYYIRNKIKNITQLKKEMDEKFNCEVKVRKSTCLIDDKWLQTKDLVVYF